MHPFYGLSSQSISQRGRKVCLPALQQKTKAFGKRRSQESSVWKGPQYFTGKGFNSFLKGRARLGKLFSHLTAGGFCPDEHLADFLTCWQARLSSCLVPRDYHVPSGASGVDTCHHGVNVQPLCGSPEMDAASLCWNAFPSCSSSRSN